MMDRTGQVWMESADNGRRVISIVLITSSRRTGKWWEHQMLYLFAEVTNGEASEWVESKTCRWEDATDLERLH